MSSKRDDKKKFGEVLKAKLAEFVPLEFFAEQEKFQDQIMSGGVLHPTWMSLIVDKLVRIAANPKSDSLPAIQTIIERVEGKAPVAVVMEDSNRLIDERIDNVSQAHLNHIANRIIQPVIAAAEGSPGPVAGGVVDVPEDGAGSAQEVRDERGVADGASQDGGS